MINKIYQMIGEAEARIIKTMQERGITRLALIPSLDEYAEQRGVSPEDAEEDYENERRDEAPQIIFFDKWGNARNYYATAMELEKSPAFDRLRFRIDCYDEDDGTEQHYTSEEIVRETLADVYDAAMKRLGLDDEPEPIWVLHTESVYDYELLERTITVFRSEADAREAFKCAVEKARKTARVNEWEVGTDSDTGFEAYPDGYCATSHEYVELSKTELN